MGFQLLINKTQWKQLAIFALAMIVWLSIIALETINGWLPF
jgi:uncharacterized protein (DUF983 family)